MRSIVVVALASVFCTSLSGGLATAAPTPRGGATAPKGVGPNVYKKLGLPAIQVSKVTRTPLPKSTTPDEAPGWTAPVVPAIASEVKLDVTHPSADAIGIGAEKVVRLESVARHDNVTGWHFLAGEGKIGIWMPASAISGLQVIMSCHGDLPNKMRVRMHEILPDDYIGSYSMLLMELHNLYDRASFFVDVGTITPGAMVWLQLEAASDVGGQWRVDGCSIKPAS